jgi:hypothetical protein
METILYGWPFLGLAIALVMLAVMLGRPYPAGWSARLRDPQWLIWLATPMYMLHQFEEHGFDLLGRRYHFIEAMCQTLGYSGSGPDCPADPAFILAVNITAVWAAGPVAGVLSERRPFAGIALWGLPLVNALGHIVPGLLHGAYNPGVVTSVVLFLPLGIWAMRQFHAQGLLPTSRVPLVIGCGIFQHLVLMGSLQAVSHGVFGHGVQNAIQVFNGFVPIALGFLVATPRAAPVAA